MKTMKTVALGLSLLATPAWAEPTVNVLVQSSYEAGTAQTFVDNFKVQRTLVWLKAQPNPLLGYQIMFNPAKRLSSLSLTSSNGKITAAPRDESIIQDAIVILGNKHLSLSVGQQRPALSEEALTPFADLPLPNRPLYENESANFGFFRDIGALATAKNDLGALSLGVFNGEGAGLAEKSEAKDLNARLVLTPIEPLKLAAGKYTSAAGRLKERNDLSIGWKQGPWDLQAEGMTGADGTTQKQGWHLQGAYRLTPSFLGIARYEGWDPGVGTREKDATAGLNWFFDPSEKNKLIFAYTFQDLERGEDNHRFSVLWQAML